THGSELWKSDGTAAGTTLVKDISAGRSSSYLSRLTNVNGTAFFVANDGTTGSELWKSDGTAAGTTPVKDLNPGNAGYVYGDLTDVNGTLFFTDRDATGKPRLWQSDGTAAGTLPVANLTSFSKTNFNGTLFFTADDGVHGSELWRLVVGPTPGPNLALGRIPETATAGDAASFTVVARNPDGSTNAGYVGIVHFTSNDPKALLPADYAFTPSDGGE